MLINNYIQCNIRSEIEEDKYRFGFCAIDSTGRANFNADLRASFELDRINGYFLLFSFLIGACPIMNISDASDEPAVYLCRMLRRSNNIEIRQIFFLFREVCRRQTLQF